MGAHGGRHDAARKEQLINAFMGSEFRALLQLVVDILLRTAGVIHPDHARIALGHFLKSASGQRSS